MSLLEVRNLSVAFGTKRVVDDVSFNLDRGETLALVGESGSGKSLTALSLLRLLPRGGGNPTGTIRLDGHEMVDAPPDILHKARGDLAGIVFQEPMTSLNPLHRIGRQVAEAITLHRRLPRVALMERVVRVLDEAGQRPNLYVLASLAITFRSQPIHEFQRLPSIIQQRLAVVRKRQ